MPNIGLLPSCLFFSHLLIISSSGPVTSLSVSVSHLLTFTSPAPSLSYFLSLLPFLKFSHFHASHTPSPFSTCSADSSAAAARCHTSRPAPVAPRVPCDTGRRGCGGRGAELQQAPHEWHCRQRADQKTDGRLPTGPQSRDRWLPTWQNTSVGGT